MHSSKHPEQFIGEALADFRYTFEVEHDMAETLEALVQALRLRARHQLLALVLGQPYRHQRSGEAVFLRRGEGVEHRFRRARAVIGQTHHNQRAGCIGRALQQHVQWAFVVAEMQASRLDVEGIEYLGGEENAFARVMGGVGGQLAFGQFEYGLARVVQSQRLLDLQEDAFAVVGNPAVSSALRRTPTCTLAEPECSMALLTISVTP